jgi:hypothetical protein
VHLKGCKLSATADNALVISHTLTFSAVLHVRHVVACIFISLLTTNNNSQQSSLLLKIIMVQWMNTAFIIWIIKPKSSMLNEDYIKQISNILWADAFTQVRYS